MFKYQLEDGFVVITRTGKHYLMIGTAFIAPDESISISRYTLDLLYKDTLSYREANMLIHEREDMREQSWIDRDIVKVCIKPSGSWTEGFADSLPKELVTIWERK